MSWPGTRLSRLPKGCPSLYTMDGWGEWPIEGAKTRERATFDDGEKINRGTGERIYQTSLEKLLLLRAQAAELARRLRFCSLSAVRKSYSGRADRIALRL